VLLRLYPVVELGEEVVEQELVEVRQEELVVAVWQLAQPD
jgi:hypothetical protein